MGLIHFTTTGTITYSLEIADAYNTDTLRTQVSLYFDGINNFAYLAYRSAADKFSILCIKNNGTPHWNK